MKIAIPTADGFTINQHFTPAKGFLVSTIQFGEVVEQEMRSTPNSEILASEDESYKKLVDCNKVIVREIESNQSNFLQLQKIDVIKTDETIITKVLMQYIKIVMQKESDTCCSP
ncbi:MAG: NifB/NifX family molybdenum-iron cluster-binding protein [Bacteroidales bacterium]|jgi:predicted Fe-Mo cluster-binding NifX family protein